MVSSPSSHLGGDLDDARGDRDTLDGLERDVFDGFDCDAVERDVLGKRAGGDWEPWNISFAFGGDREPWDCGL